MTVYLDSSALVKLFILETETPAVQDVVEAARLPVTSQLTYVETCAALARARASERLSAEEHGAGLRKLALFWSRLATVEVQADLIHRAARLAERHLLRGSGAVHLASALEVRGSDGVMFACFDHDLREAARGERLDLLPL